MVGSDECGAGSWAGPLVVCAVVLSKDWPLTHLVKDSKAFKGKNAEAQRQKVAKQIIPAVTYAIVSSSPAEIDETGIYKLLPVVHGRAIDAVIAKHEALGAIGTNAVVVDGTLKVTYGKGQQALSLPKGDSLIAAISAASIIGKVARDVLMTKLSEKFPGYAFESNKGYGGNQAHDAGLAKLGVCEIHRKSFGPIRERLKEVETGSFDYSALGGDDDAPRD